MKYHALSTLTLECIQKNYHFYTSDGVVTINFAFFVGQKMQSFDALRSVYDRNLWEHDFDKLYIQPVLLVRIYMEYLAIYRFPNVFILLVTTLLLQDLGHLIDTFMQESDNTGLGVVSTELFVLE